MNLNLFNNGDGDRGNDDSDRRNNDDDDDDRETRKIVLWVQEVLSYTKMSFSEE